MAQGFGRTYPCPDNGFGGRCLYKLGPCADHRADANGPSRRSRETARDLTLYVGRSESLVGPIIEQFERLRVSMLRSSMPAPPSWPQLCKKREAGARPTYSSPRTPEGWAPWRICLSVSRTLRSISCRSGARSPDGKWVGISGRARTVVYNPETMTEADLPDDIWDFVDPEVERAQRLGTHQRFVSDDGYRHAGPVG